MPTFLNDSIHEIALNSLSPITGISKFYSLWVKFNWLAISLKKFTGTQTCSCIYYYKWQEMSTDIWPRKLKKIFFSIWPHWRLTLTIHKDTEKIKINSYT